MKVRQKKRKKERPDRETGQVRQKMALKNNKPEGSLRVLNKIKHLECQRNIKFNEEKPRKILQKKKRIIYKKK